MSREKQIEEMAKIMNECCNVYDEQGNHIRNKCGECEEWSNDNHCCCSYNTKEAEALYNAGYRKQSEGEWVDQYNGKYANPKYVCSLCGKGTLLTPYVNELNNMEMTQALSSFCPNCGAKMKGGAE